MEAALTTRIKLFDTPLPVSPGGSDHGRQCGVQREMNFRWNTSPRHTRLSLLGDTTLCLAISRMYDDRSRRQCSVLTQRRTGHVGLNTYLHCCNLAASSHCLLCAVPETVPHFLLLCPVFRRQRLELILKLGTARLSLKLLLGMKADHKSVLSFVRNTNHIPRYLL
jgi:hypothetical protein